MGEIGAGFGSWIASGKISLRIEELSVEPFEGAGVVDVVPLAKQFDWQLKFRCALQGFGGDDGGAPGDVFEEMRVRLLQADQVVAAVFGGAEDGALTGDEEQLGCANIFRGGDGGTVGVDEADGGESASEEVFGGGQEALAKAVSALGDEQRAVIGGCRERRPLRRWGCRR